MLQGTENSDFAEGSRKALKFVRGDQKARDLV